MTGFVAYRGAVLVADIRALGLPATAGAVLVFGGRRQELARYPNRDPADRHGGAWAYVDGERIGMYADRPDDGGYNATNRNLDFWQRNIRGNASASSPISICCRLPKSGAEPTMNRSGSVPSGPTTITPCRTMSIMRISWTIWPDGSR